MKKRKKIIVVLPSYNASLTLAKTYREIPKGSYDEIILVDDGSTDNTVKIAKKLGIKHFIHEKNKGYGANQKTCYKEALKRGADIIVMLHPDYQYDPTILPSLTVPIEYGYADVVLASRILGNPHYGGALEGGMPFYKFVANKLLTFFQNKMFGMHFSEYHTGYRAYSKKILKKINFNNFSNDYLFDNQMVVECIKKGAKFMEVPVKTAYFKEASSINLVRSLRYGFGIIALTVSQKIRRKRNTNSKKNNHEISILTYLTILGFAFIFAVDRLFFSREFMQFSSLADSFLHGKLFFLQNAHTYYDTAFFNGHYYWPLGPFPALILMPFVSLFGNGFKDGYLSLPVIGIIFALTFLLGLNITKNKISALWVSIGYIFSTAFIGVALNPFSWQFAQLIQNLLIFFAILGAFKKWHPTVIGFFVACAIATRFDMIFASIFFLAVILWENDLIVKRIKNAIYFLIPVFFSLISLGVYNYLRFGSFFEQGYSLQKLVVPELIANRAAGLWGLIHFPANLFYFFLKSPDPVVIHGSQVLVFPYLNANPWGMSVLITSPMFLAIFKANPRNKFVIFSVITALFIFILVMGYYGIGYMQYGYRYALDFYPFLFVILLFAVKKSFPFWLKVLILITFFTNAYLFLF